MFCVTATLTPMIGKWKLPGPDSSHTGNDMGSVIKYMYNVHAFLISTLRCFDTCSCTHVTNNHDFSLPSHLYKAATWWSISTLPGLDGNPL